MGTRIYSTAVEAAEECGRYILVLLEDAMAAGAPATLAISGGSTPKAMFEYFAKTDFPWDRVHLFWVDERCVPATDPQSNFKMTHDVWLGPSKFLVANIHRVRTELPPPAAAADYVEQIRTVFGTAAIPRFEVIHLGMGADAHTASLFPGDANTSDRDHIAKEIWAPKMNQWRVTLLPGVIQSARHCAVLAAGADKAQPLQSVLHGPLDVLRYPAQLARNGEWFLDKHAAGGATSA